MGKQSNIKNDEYFFNIALGRRISTLRKIAGITQIEMAKMLGLEQASISRIESGVQWLSPAQLVKLCSHFGVSAEAMFSGKINTDEVALRFGQATVLPERYTTLEFTKVRELLPLIAFARKQKGDRFIDSFLEETQISRVLMMSPSHSVGINCYLDVVGHLVKGGVLHAKAMTELGHLTNQPEMHSFLDEIYGAHEGAMNLMRSRIANAHHYDGNFIYKLSRAQDELIEVKVRPEKHMAGISYRGGVLKDTICRIRKESLRLFPEYSGLKPMKLVETHCHFKGEADECTYRLYEHQQAG